MAMSMSQTKLEHLSGSAKPKSQETRESPFVEVSRTWLNDWARVVPPTRVHEGTLPELIIVETEVVRAEKDVTVDRRTESVNQLESNEPTGVDSEALYRDLIEKMAKWANTSTRLRF